jgi:hypothetical protein
MRTARRHMRGSLMPHEGPSTAVHPAGLTQAGQHLSRSPISVVSVGVRIEPLPIATEPPWPPSAAASFTPPD